MTMRDGTTPRELKFTASFTAGAVSALVIRPADAQAMLVIGHGAGAGMRHAFMEAVARRLAGRGVATLRYQFPYMEKGSRRPDPRPVLLATVRAAVATACAQTPDLPLPWPTTPKLSISIDSEGTGREQKRSPTGRKS